MTDRGEISDSQLDARSYVRLSRWSAAATIGLAAAVIGLGWVGGLEWAKGGIHPDWPTTTPWTAILFALVAVGALAGRTHPGMATWFFGGVLATSIGLGLGDLARLGGSEDSFFATPQTGVLVVVGMTSAGAVLLVTHKAPATRTTLLTTATIFAAASIFVVFSAFEGSGIGRGVSMVAGVMAVLAVTAVGGIDETVAPAILTRTRPAQTLGRLGLGVTVSIPVITYIDAGYSFVRPQWLAVISGLLIVGAIAGSVSWFGWSDFEAQAWRQIAENATDAVIEVDTKGVIRRATGECEEVTGWKRSDLEGRKISELIHPGSRDQHEELMAEYVEQPTPRTMGSRALPVLGPDGVQRLAIVRLVPVIGPDGLLVCAALTEASRESELQHLATHDPLTEVLNRAGITDTLQRELLSRRDCGVLFVDLDNLKVINDDLSHAAGDSALLAVAQAIESRLRGRDRVGRIGGDEFACVITDLTDMSHLHDVAAQIAAAIRAVRLDGPGWSTEITASIGGVVASSFDDAAQALASADECMYAVKKAGGDGVFIMGRQGHELGKTDDNRGSADRRSANRRSGPRRAADRDDPGTTGSPGAASDPTHRDRPARM